MFIIKKTLANMWVPYPKLNLHTIFQGDAKMAPFALFHIHPFVNPTTENGLSEALI